MNRSLAEVPAKAVLMLQEDMWPFTPVSLRQIMDQETLSVLVAGCRERLGRDLIIIDADADTGRPTKRIDAFRPKQYYEPFCEMLRDSIRIDGGDRACRRCDLQVARTQFRAEAPQEPRFYRCHMGLVDSACSIAIYGRQVAVLIAGQFRPAKTEDFQRITENIGRLERGEYAGIQVRDESVGLDLQSLADQLIRPPAAFRQNMEREVRHITRIATAEYDHQKASWERGLIERLRAEAAGSVTSLADIRHMTHRLLELVRAFCRCEYIMFFANVREHDTVLPAIGHIGVPAEVGEQLPHFNWRKAGLPLAPEKIRDWDLQSDLKTAVRGLRGGAIDNLEDPGCILPATLGELFRGVIVFGPFAEPIDLATEQAFLTEITRVLSRHVLTELHKLSLLHQQGQWRSTAQLITHQVRTTMMSLLTQVGMSQMLVEQAEPFPQAERIGELLKNAEELGMRLGSATAETLNSHVLHLEKDDFVFDSHPLSALVANCAGGYARVAADQQRRLVIDESVEMLPHAEVDVARLTIALSNVIENAIKYSFPKTTIYIRRGAIRDYTQDTEKAFIEIEDLGHEIPAKERQRIFEQGRRAVVGATASIIGGSGLGLWEAQAVLKAHDGSIRFTSRPTRHYHRNRQGHVVNFILEIPLRQEL